MSTMPSTRPSCSSSTIRKNATDTTIMSGTSIRTIRCATTSAPPTAAASPSASRMLAMFDPTTLPIASEPA
jgi:hypothetical protein